MKYKAKVFSTNNEPKEISQYQIDVVRERTKKYLENPESATDIEDFLKEIKNEL